MNHGWRDRARPWLLGLSMALGLGTALLGAPACNTDVSLEEGCHAICACIGFLPSEHQSCETQCLNTSNAPPQECLRCASEAVSCTAFNTQCGSACQFDLPGNP